MILERTDLVAKLYTVDMSRAINILGTKWNDPKTLPTLEALADPSNAEVRVLPKTLVLDLSSLSGVPEKIEGLSVLDQNTIAIANDNGQESNQNGQSGAAPLNLRLPHGNRSFQ